MGFVALLTVVTLELVRASGPLIDTAYGRSGPLGAVRLALIGYAAPGLAAALLLALARRLHRAAPVVLLLGAVLVAALRIFAQGLTGGSRVAVGLVAVAMAVAVLTQAVAVLAGRPGGGRTAAASVALGAAGGVGLQLALGTWDAIWRHTALGWWVAGSLGAGLVLLALAGVRDPGTPARARVGRLWALGPLLALGAMMLANPAFVAAQSGLPLAVAGPLNAVGLLAAGLASGRFAGGRRGAVGVCVALVGGVAVTLGVVAGTRAGSILILLALALAQLGAVGALARALEPAGVRSTAATRVPVSTAGTATVVGLTTIVPLFLYQLDYDVPLGFPNLLVLVATACGLAAAGLRRVPLPPLRDARWSTPCWPVLLGAGLLVVTGTAVAASAAAMLAADREAAADRFSGRVLTWNVHYGVTPSGSVDLEALAETIESEDPDVVVLQEVSRGWVQGGGADQATWLSQRLGRPFAFGAAADGRFGNVVLARGGLTDVSIQRLPYGIGPQRRSAVSSTVRVGSTAMTVTSIHLQHRSAATATRVAQVQAFLTTTGEPGTPRLLAGDLNATPGGPEVRPLAEAGWVSAIDAAGDPSTLTYPSGAPNRRTEWIFGQGVTFTGARALTGVRLSDHLPVVATIR